MIKVTNLTKKFGDFTAVDSISFEVPKGQIFAFLGPNGAGKTTTIKMLTTLLDPSKGTIKINGANPHTNKDAVRSSFGIVFQDPSLDDELTAQENMVFHAVLYSVPTSIREKRVEDLLRFVELWDKRNNLVKTFSGGMKRRLEIARGLLHHPKVLFLDEPTQGLDPQTRNHIWEHITRLNKKENITVFFTTHYMDEAERYAKQIAVIDHGKIVAEGTVASLKKKTKKKSLEEAFIELTGHEIREEGAGAIDHLRQGRRMWGGKKMTIIYILWLRQLKRYFRSKSRIVGSLGQPILFLVALGYGLGPVFESAGRGSYLQFIAPGVIAMSILFTAVFSGIEIIWDRQFGFLKETLVAPVSRFQIMFGRTLGGATVAMAQGVIVLVLAIIIGFRPTGQNYLAAIFIMFLIAMAFTALGTAIASKLEDMQGFQLIMNFVVMPIYFLSGAFFPLEGLGGTLKIVTSLDPLTYGVDGLRGSLVGIEHFGLGQDILILGTVTAVLIGLGSYFFSKIQV